MTVSDPSAKASTRRRDLDIRFFLPMNPFYNPLE
jgi:hypothetical protein